MQVDFDSTHLTSESFFQKPKNEINIHLTPEVLKSFAKIETEIKHSKDNWSFSDQTRNSTVYITFNSEDPFCFNIENPTKNNHE